MAAARKDRDALALFADELKAHRAARGWTQQTLAPSGIEPGLNSTASFGPTQGGLLLFKLPTSVYSNRPLTLQIFAPGGGRGAISLDL